VGSHSEEPVTGLPTRRSLREAERRTAAEPVSAPVAATAPRTDPDSPTSVHHVPSWAHHAPATEPLAVPVPVAKQPTRTEPLADRVAPAPRWASAPVVQGAPAVGPLPQPRVSWAATPVDQVVAQPTAPASPATPAPRPAATPAAPVTQTARAARPTALVATPAAPAPSARPATPFVEDVPELAVVTHGTARRRRPTRTAARLGVLGVLAGITVVIPVSQGVVPGPVAFGSDALADSTLPTTVSALAGSPLSALPPTSLVSADGAMAARSLSASSRTEVRTLLPGCDGSVRPAGQNGLLKVSDLCTLWDNHTQLRADAAVSLAEFNQAFAARFGGDLCLASGYRTLAEQRAVKAQKGGLAAVPGKSNHGWGLAVDLCQDQTSGVKWRWINENGPTYGWQNPAWALPGGSGPHEKWHWEYAKGVQQDGEYYDG
jgi:hypothetical protein